MNLCQGYNKQVVIVTTLIQRRYLTLLGIEDPLHCLTGRTETYYIVLVIEHILTLLNLETELSGILLEVSDSLVLRYILAELIICVRISLLREIDGVLNNSYIILVDHCLAGCYLKDDATCRELKELNIIDCKSLDAVKVVLAVLIHSVRVLVHCRGEPLLCTLLTVLLGCCLKVSTCLESYKDTVSSLLCCLRSSTCHLDLTILDRVRSLSLGKELNNIESVVRLCLERLCGLTNAH